MTTNKLKLGKRQLGDALEENCETETMKLNQKRAKMKFGDGMSDSKMKFGDGMSDSISARVEDHPCRKP